EGDHEVYRRFAEVWSQQVASAQWKSSQSVEPGAPENCVLFPYGGNDGAPPPGAYGPFEGKVSVELDDAGAELPHDPFPTPFGQAEALALFVDQSAKWMKLAKSLWVGVALGWLDIDALDLQATSGEARSFDRIAAEMDPDARFTGIIRVSTSDALPPEL